MAAEKKRLSGSRFGRLRDRVAEAAGTATLNHGRGRAFGPFVRLGQPANDNRPPLSLVILRIAVTVALLGLTASMVL
jgi:hypothetical protein